MFIEWQTFQFGVLVWPNENDRKMLFIIYRRGSTCVVCIETANKGKPIQFKSGKDE